jgi:hypothetical protein
MLQVFVEKCFICVFMLQLVSVFMWMLHKFHTYVVNVCSKCFICFRRMLHSSVSCCKCLILFGESWDHRKWRTHGRGRCVCGATNGGGLLESPVTSYTRDSRSMLAPWNNIRGLASPTYIRRQFIHRPVLPHLDQIDVHKWNQTNLSCHKGKNSRRWGLAEIRVSSSTKPT